MDNKLHDSFGTWRTLSRVIELEMGILPFPDIEESEPSAILILRLPAQGEYVRNKFWESVI